MILLSSPLKYEPLKNVVSIIFSPNFNNHNQNSQFKKFEKNPLSTSVDDELT